MGGLRACAIKLHVFMLILANLQNCTGVKDNQNKNFDDTFHSLFQMDDGSKTIPVSGNSC